MFQSQCRLLPTAVLWLDWNFWCCNVPMVNCWVSMNIIKMNLAFLNGPACVRQPALSHITLSHKLLLGTSFSFSSHQSKSSLSANWLNGISSRQHFRETVGLTPALWSASGGTETDTSRRYIWARNGILMSALRDSWKLYGVQAAVASGCMGFVSSQQAKRPSFRSEGKMSIIHWQLGKRNPLSVLSETWWSWVISVINEKYTLKLINNCHICCSSLRQIT